MIAVICTKYGPPEVLEVREVDKPIPKDNEVLVKVHATTVTASDTIIRAFKLPRLSPIGMMMGFMLGFRAPRKPILGMDIAGEVEAAGKSVKRFRAGDQIFGNTFSPSNQVRFGAYAQYTSLPEDSLIVSKPSLFSYEEAAAIPYGAGLAWYFLKQGDIQAGQKVLIYGASGAIGTAAVQLAKTQGAAVIGVCSTTNLDLVKSLGAEKVYDYTKVDAPDSGELFDVVLDAVGESKSSNFKIQSREALTSTGKYISVDVGSPSSDLEDHLYFRELMGEGKLKAVIDRSYPLEQIVEAHRYVDGGHKKGSVVITVGHDE